MYVCIYIYISVCVCDFIRMCGCLRIQMISTFIHIPVLPQASLQYICLSKRCLQSWKQLLPALWPWPVASPPLQCIPKGEIPQSKVLPQRMLSVDLSGKLDLSGPPTSATKGLVSGSTEGAQHQGTLQEAHKQRCHGSVVQLLDKGGQRQKIAELHS